MDALEATVKMAKGGSVEAITADVTDEASINALFAQIKTRHGRLDVVFNNAGNNLESTNFGDLDFAGWKRVIDVNLNGAFLIANRAYCMMRDQSPQGGRIINNGSISAHVPRPAPLPTPLPNTP